MKQIVSLVLVAIMMTTSLFAGGDIAPLEVYEEEKIESESQRQSKFYIVVGGLILLGDEVQHNDALLNGGDALGYGYGIDIGYRIGNGFAVEYDFTHGRNNVKEIKEDEKVEGKSIYYTSAIDLVYTYEATEQLGIFGKVGYEFESETIDELDIEERENDFVFGLGIEYSLNQSYKAVVEYEHSKIEGPHGDAILAGVMYNF